MIPFTDNSAHVTDDFCTERRLDETLAFLQGRDFLGAWLDVGPTNHVADTVSTCWGKRYMSTSGDLNFENWDVYPTCLDPFSVVTCFEVIEHVMNPLSFLLLLRDELTSGGVLYLSTPVHNRFGFYFNETNHFTEYKESSLRTLVEYAGFRITDYHQFRSIPFWQGMKRGGGLFRTALRVSSQRTQILRAVKI